MCRVVVRAGLEFQWAAVPASNTANCGRCRSEVFFGYFSACVFTGGQRAVNP